MLEDAKTGKINLIIVKDLSRFGRNYIQVGQYIDYIFPTYNIRFIALSDNVDTANKDTSAMDMMPIVNLFNEWHHLCSNAHNKTNDIIIAFPCIYGGISEKMPPLLLIDFCNRKISPQTLLTLQTLTSLI